MTQRNKRRSAENPRAVKFDRSDSGMAGGVLILGGIVAVGAVAGAIAALRRKTSNKTDDEYGKRGDGNSKRTPRENGNGGGLRSLLQIHGKQFSPLESPDDDAPHEGEEPSPETIAGKEINGEDPAIIFDFPRFSDDLVTHISCNLHDGKYFPSDSRRMETDSNREISDSSPTSICSTYQKKTEIPGQNSGDIAGICFAIPVSDRTSSLESPSIKEIKSENADLNEEDDVDNLMISRGAEDPLKSTELSEGEEEDYDDNMNVIRGEVEPLKEPGYVEDISESLLRTDDACSNGSISSSVATEHEAIWPEDINESKIDEFSPNVADKLLEEINEVKSDEIDGAPPDVADKFPEKSNESKIEEINGVPPHLVDKLSEEINKAKVEEEIHGDFPRVTEKFSYEIELKTKDFGRTYSDSLVEGEEIKENAGDKVKNPLLNEEKETEEKEIVELEEKGTAVREESELIHREERDIIVDREETEQDAEKLQFVNKAKNGERAGFIMEMKSYLKEEGVWQWNLATIVWAWVLVAAVVLAISLLKRRNTGYGISV